MYNMRDITGAIQILKDLKYIKKTGKMPKGRAAKFTTYRLEGLIKLDKNDNIKLTAKGKRLTTIRS